MSQVYTTGQVARVFSVNINTVIKWFDDGKLEGFRLPRSNERRIYRESVLAFMQLNDIPPEFLDQFDRNRVVRPRGRAAKKARPSRKGPELRTFPRKPVELPAVVEGRDGYQAQVTVRNLSMGGVYLTGFRATEKVIPEEFRLRVQTDGRPALQGTCQIVHLHRVDEDTMSFGCRFTQVDPGSLQSYLAAL